MDYSKTTAEILFAAFAAKQTAFPLTFAQVNVSAPTVVPANQVATFTISAKAGNGFNADVETITYSRMNVQTAVTAANAAALTQVWGEKTLISEAVDVFNAATGLNLVAGTDYTDGALPAEAAEGPTPVSISLAASKIYFGTLVLQLTGGQIAPLADAIDVADIGELPLP